MTFDFAETYADLFCIQAEVTAILDRHREPRDMNVPGFWGEVQRQALADWHAGHIPIWRRTSTGAYTFAGFEDEQQTNRTQKEDC